MKSLLLWCSPEHSPLPGYLTVYWTQYISEQERAEGNISLPEVIGKDVNYWKPRYLSWIDEVGKRPCGDTTVVDALVIRPGLSYWWMTIPSEFSFSPTSIAYSTLRLWALAQIADALSIQEVRVVGADPALEEVLRLWSKRTGRQLTINPGPVENMEPPQNESIRARIKQGLPPIVTGLSYLVLQYFGYFTLRRPRPHRNTVDAPAITIVDYFDSLDVTAARESRYISNYWGPLESVFSQAKGAFNWIHIDVRSSALPNVRSSRDVVLSLNQNHETSHHVLLQDYLTIGVTFKAVANYMRIRKIAKRVSARIQWVDSASGIDVSALAQSQLKSDLLGVGAARNALWASLFEASISAQTAHDACIYLMENQTWELALIHAWQSLSESSTIGIAHAPIRDWDLRYALGSSTINARNVQSLPRPSSVAVIDPTSETIMIANGLEPSAIVKVEAMRYLSPTATTSFATNKRTGTFAKQRILILGEYESMMCAKQLQLLEELAPLTKHSWEFMFRPHPSNPILQGSLPVGVSLSKRLRVGDDLAECDVALCSNLSSASLDASLMGIPILMFRDGRGFNGSPLNDGPSVKYVNDVTDMAEALEGFWIDGEPRSRTQIYPFYLDHDLQRWRALIGSFSGNGSQQTQ